MKKSMRSLLIFWAMAIMIFSCLSVSATTDATNDVWHQKWTGTGYEWEAYSGSKPSIDITDVSYSMDGATATVTMTTAGNMAPNTENVVYTMHLQSGESAYYMIMYTNGQGVVMGMGDYQGFTSQLTNPISGNTFSASFEVSNPSANYKIIGFNVESTDIDNDQGEAWWDYAPNDEAPYYSPGGDDTGGDTGGDDTGGDSGGDDETPPPQTPGFEAIAVIAALAVALFIIKKRD